jgi:transposase
MKQFTSGRPGKVDGDIVSGRETMALYVRTLKADERARLQEILRLQPYDEMGRRARIVLMSADHVGVQEISAAADLHPINVRKWIHRFNRYGLNGLYPRRSPGRPKLFTDEQREAIVGMASTNPQELGLNFDAWSLQRLRYELTERGIAPDISAETIRQELLRNGLTFEHHRWIRASN